MGAPMARMEFLDEVQMRACNKQSGLGLPETPTLFLEFHGTVASVKEQAGRAQEIAAVTRRSRLRLGDAPGGPHAALEGAALRLLRLARAARGLRLRGR